MNVLTLEHRSNVRLIRCARAKSLDGSGLVSEGQKAGIGELIRVEGLFGKFGNGLFNLDYVHLCHIFWDPVTTLQSNSFSANALASATVTTL